MLNAVEEARLRTLDAEFDSAIATAHEIERSNNSAPAVSQLVDVFRRVSAAREQIIRDSAVFGA